jgi:tRNA G18 (ribose-2'-O)-methylase SpoU
MIEPYHININPRPDMSANVKDMYKESTAAEIRADLDTRRTGLVNVFQNLTSDFNLSSGIRSNNAFCGRRVYVVGRRRYDRRGTVGTYHYEHVYHADGFGEVLKELHDDGYVVFAVDNVMRYHPKSIWDVRLPYKSAFVYGEERRGLSDDVIEACDGMVFVENPGSVRSMNVACAASCVMMEYARQHRM